MNKHLLYDQLYSLIENEPDLIANISNVTAFLNQILDDINWVGFYFIDKNELVLGPFQGKVACTRIPLGKGVCGVAALNDQTLRIDNVHEFSGHIACDHASNSEIVIPVHSNHQVIGVLDIDSPSFHRFSKHDQDILEKIVLLLEEALFDQKNNDK